MNSFLLEITIINPDGDLEQLFYYGPLEEGLEVINNLTNQGDDVRMAHLVDRQQRIELPLEAFDGQPIIEPLQQLVEQWQAILESAVPAATVKSQVVIQELQRRVSIYASLCDFYELYIERIRAQLARATERDWAIDQQPNVVRYFQELLVQQELSRTLALQRYEGASKRLEGLIKQW